jgi:hypothetical protein
MEGARARGISSDKQDGMAQNVINQLSTFEEHARSQKLRLCGALRLGDRQAREEQNLSR